MTLKSDQDHQSYILYPQCFHVCINRDLCRFFFVLSLAKGSKWKLFWNLNFFTSFLKKTHIISCYFILFVGISIELYGVMYINRYWAILLSKWMQSLCLKTKNKKKFHFQIVFYVFNTSFLFNFIYPTMFV